MLAVIGGADVYELFWEQGYDAFHLTRVARAFLPGGRPVFRELALNRTPEEVLAPDIPRHTVRRTEAVADDLD